MTHKYLDTERIAIYPGSFNPFTTGHMSILRRGLKIFDRVVVVIGINDSKMAEAVTDERLAAVRDAVAGMERVDVMAWNGLTVDVARKVGAKFILRGVRTVADYEYERGMADVNREIGGVETVVLFTEPQLAMVSSSLVRELDRYGYDTSAFVCGKK